MRHTPISYWILIVGGLFCASPAAAQQPKLTADQWREDLRYFAREMPRRHKNLFHSVTRATFEERVAALDRDIPSLPPHQIVVRLKQISSLVGDGHTGVHLPQWFQTYPIVLYWFGNELRVTAAHGVYERSLGTRVVAIGNLTIDTVMARVATMLPSAADENEWVALNAGPILMPHPEVLQALGIVADLGPAPFVFQDDQGERFTLNIAPVPSPVATGTTATIAGLVAAVPRPPLWRRRPMDPFWFILLPDSQSVYVSFRSYRDMGDAARRMFAFADSVHAKRLIIDLRQNDGGDFYEGRRHLIEPIKARPSFNQRGRLYVLVGRRTFSAAMINSADFRKETNAILVGEPIGERPNSYSENDELTLPNSKIVVSYSTAFYQPLARDVPAILPDIRVDATWAEFRAGRDPVLDSVLRRPLPSRTVIRAGQILDPVSGRLSSGQTIVVDGDRITTVGRAPTPAPDDRLIDLSAYTVLPGLIDAHVHLGIGGTPRDNAKADLDAGFTTVVDLGARTTRILRIRDSMSAGQIPGPRVLAAGLWVGKQGGVCEFNGLGIVGGAEAYRQRVRDNIQAGADVIKACVSGWPAQAWQDPQAYELPDSILSAIVTEATRLGRPVLAHDISAGGVRAAANAGVRGLAHAAFLDEATARLVKERGMFLIPTLASLTAGDTSIVSRELFSATRLAYRAGVTLVFGTDGGVLPHGQNAEEFVALGHAGIPMADAIRSATIGAAQALGLADSVGVIAPAKVADIIAVSGNPLADPAVLKQVRFVMARGVVAKQP